MDNSSRENVVSCEVCSETVNRISYKEHIESHQRETLKTKPKRKPKGWRRCKPTRLKKDKQTRQTRTDHSSEGSEAHGEDKEIDNARGGFITRDRQVWQTTAASEHDFGDSEAHNEVDESDDASGGLSSPGNLFPPGRLSQESQRADQNALTLADPSEVMPEGPDHKEGREAFTCELCGKLLSNKYSLQRHMDVHSRPEFPSVPKKRRKRGRRTNLTAKKYFTLKGRREGRCAVLPRSLTNDSTEGTNPAESGPLGITGPERASERLNDPLAISGEETVGITEQFRNAVWEEQESTAEMPRKYVRKTRTKHRWSHVKAATARKKTGNRLSPQDDNPESETDDAPESAGLTSAVPNSTTGPNLETVRIVGRGHASCFEEILKEWWQNELHTDVSFHFGREDGILRAHSSVLAAASPVFAGIFQNAAGGDEDFNVLVPGFSRHAFQLALEFIYNGTLRAKMTQEELGQLLTLINMFRVKLPQMPVTGKKQLKVLLPKITAVGSVLKIERLVSAGQLRPSTSSVFRLPAKKVGNGAVSCGTTPSFKVFPAELRNREDTVENFAICDLPSDEVIELPGSSEITRDPLMLPESPPCVTGDCDDVSRGSSPEFFDGGQPVDSDDEDPVSAPPVKKVKRNEGAESVQDDSSTSSSLQEISVSNLTIETFSEKPLEPSALAANRLSLLDNSDPGQSPLPVQQPRPEGSIVETPVTNLQVSDTFSRLQDQAVLVLGSNPETGADLESRPAPVQKLRPKDLSKPALSTFQRVSSPAFPLNAEAPTRIVPYVGSTAIQKLRPKIAKHLAASMQSPGETLDPGPPLSKLRPENSTSGSSAAVENPRKPTPSSSIPTEMVEPGISRTSVPVNTGFAKKLKPLLPKIAATNNIQNLVLVASGIPILPRMKPKIPERRTQNPGKVPVAVEIEPEESEEDLNDMKLADTFLKAEVTQHHFLTNRLELLGKELVEAKEIARKMLKHPAIQNRQFPKDWVNCEVCEKSIKADKFQHHMNLHLGVKKFHCAPCGISYLTLKLLNSHKRRRHPPENAVKDVLCAQCGKTFYRVADLNRHMLNHNTVKRFTCTECGQKFFKKFDLEKHVKHHDAWRKYGHTITDENGQVRRVLKCDKCPVFFGIGRHISIATHVKIHEEGVVEYPCKFCPSSFQTSKEARIHQVEAHANQMPTCSTCGKVYASKCSLRKHMALEHSDNAPEIKDHLRCSHCGLVFTNKERREAHQVSVHLKQKPFQCSLCPRSFFGIIHLKRHMLVHSDARAFKCEVCEKTFHRKDYLDRHRVIHSEVKPYVCKYCNKGFSDRNNLAQHERIHTGEKYECRICGVVFRSGVKLREHESTHNVEENN